MVEAIERFVRSVADGDFESLALRAFAFQFERVEPYRRWCERSGRSPATVVHWRDIPWIPTSVMKSVTLAAAPARVVFRSSGTTTAGERRSVHHHPFPDLYRRSIESSFPELCLPRGGRPPMLSIIPSFTLEGDSSLSFMIDHVLQIFGGDGSAAVAEARGLDLPRARSWLAARQRDGRAFLLLATALALDQLLRGFERLDLRFRAPAGSAVFLTGGFKTRHSELTLGDLLGRLHERAGIPAGGVVQEYGMTELTSQAYTRSLVGGRADVFVCPHWMRVQALDPSTLDEALPGRDGLLAVLDLANVGSALHLLTEDLGRAEDGGFRLTGRAGGAELRGCSLRAEELEAAAG
ncbi:MAG TPA: hypothetical protein VMS86_16165 [Thermoanaerobaculia bacterium]|nr:hypothetical protein [Thermoanaerobaculia bacterium]